MVMTEEEGGGEEDREWRRLRVEEVDVKVRLNAEGKGGGRAGKWTKESVKAEEVKGEERKAKGA